ncbi:hypothetical protein IWX75_003321 [Arthrobacter sp. CAN_A6]|uniref:hypothetical protein n=1 Tax=Arthrobacter sp. CAN_A6 TaxID=2787721 RepID=UPI0018CB27BE
MNYTIEVVVALIQFVLSFYAFWLVWLVLLPTLPGPRDRQDRIAPFAGYFTDPFIVPVAKVLHVSPRLIAFVALTIVAMISIALDRLPDLFG